MACGRGLGRGLIFLLFFSAGGVACGRGLGRGLIFLLFLSLADHMPE